MKIIFIGLTLLTSFSVFCHDYVERRVFSETNIQGGSEKELESKCKIKSTMREKDITKVTNNLVYELEKFPWIYHISELDNLIKINENSVQYALSEIESSGWFNKTYSGTCTVYEDKKLWEMIDSLMFKREDCYKKIENTKITQENGKRICESSNQICHLNLLYDMKLDEEDYAKVSRLCNVSLVGPEKCHDEFTSGRELGGPAIGGYPGNMAISMCDPSYTIKNVEERFDWSLLKDLDLEN